MGTRNGQPPQACWPKLKLGGLLSGPFKMIPEALPPHDMEAEAGALGCVLCAESADADRMVDRLSLEHFYEPRHRTTFSALRSLRMDGKPLNTVVLVGFLKARGDLDKLGGIPYAASLPNLTPSALNFPYYIEILEDRAARRAALRDSIELSRLASDMTIPAPVVADAARRMLEGHSSGLGEQVVACPWIDAGKGASDADILIGPGRWITRGAGVLLVGYTGSGKSTWTATQSFSWALGRESLGMRPNGPLRSLFFQAEDDAGDLETMASSIVAELSPDDVEREQIRRNVLVITESAVTGIDFLNRRVAPALRRYEPDLLWLNPLSTYMGADLNDQRECAAFLRNTLNPFLTKYRCACFVIHHCPKPSKERNSWTGGQLAYAGAGSGDIANWAREVITLRETSPGLFEMTLAKRWRKVGWKDAEGRPTPSRLIVQDRSGGQVWREATKDVLEELGAQPYSDSALLALVPEAGIDRTVLIRSVADRFGVTERTAAKFVANARQERRRNLNGSTLRFALLDEIERPRRDVYPSRPSGRPVVWLTKAASVRERAEELLRKG